MSISRKRSGTDLRQALLDSDRLIRLLIRQTQWTVSTRSDKCYNNGRPSLVVFSATTVRLQNKWQASHLLETAPAQWTCSAWLNLASPPTNARVNLFDTCSPDKARGYGERAISHCCLSLLVIDHHRCSFTSLLPIGTILLRLHPIPYLELFNKTLENALQALISPRQQHNIIGLDGLATCMGSERFEVLRYGF